ncbi:MAG: response regulator [Candidatus Nitrosocosmicus sp.]
MPSKSNILVVDDNEDIADIIKTVLEEDGFKVDAFNDPLFALEYFKSNLRKFSVVVSDIRMSGMSGIELVAHIKKLEPRVKAIFITAFDVDSIKPEIEKYDYEVAEVFQKPLPIKQLCERIRMHLDNV